MGCTHSKNEKPLKKLESPNTGLSIKTKEGYSIPVKFYNLEREFTIIYCHSASENFKLACEWVESVLLPLGLVNILVFEYFASCESSENVNESCIYSDCDALNWLLTECLRLSKRKIILYGKCIGAGVSLFLAERYPDIAGIIMQSSLTYSLRINYNFKLSFPRDFYPTAEILRRIQCPIIFLHGSQDQSTGLKYIKDFCDAIRNPNKRLVILEGGHDLPYESIVEPIKIFLSTNDYKINI